MMDGRDGLHAARLLFHLHMQRLKPLLLATTNCASSLCLPKSFPRPPTASAVHLFRFLSSCRANNVDLLLLCFLQHPLLLIHVLLHLLPFLLSCNTFMWRVSRSISACSTRTHSYSYSVASAGLPPAAAGVSPVTHPHIASEGRFYPPTALTTSCSPWPATVSCPPPSSVLTGSHKLRASLAQRTLPRL